MDEDLKKWLCERPAWLIEAAKRLLASDLTAQDVEELTDLCCDGARLSNQSVKPRLTSSLTSVSSPHELTRLVAISDIQGINALNPKKPLLFGEENLVIVYGVNGSGKSGYVRLLKQASGCSKQANKILANVFSTKSEPQMCKIALQAKDKLCELTWTPENGPLNEMIGLNVYDTDCGHVYINEDNELSFEPPALRFLSKLVDTCDIVGKKIQLKIDGEVKALPQFPVEYVLTSWGKWIQQLSYSTTCKDIKKLRWTRKDEDSLIELQQRLLEQAPIEKAIRMEVKAKAVDSIITMLANVHSAFSTEALQNIRQLKDEADQAAEIAKVHVQRVFSESPLPGIGEASWKRLWECARKYSEESGYPHEQYPVTNDGAYCVLCQQQLSADAKNRMTGFESFVKGELQQAADNAAKAHEKALEALDLKISIETILAQGNVAELNPSQMQFLEEYMRAAMKFAEEIMVENGDALDVVLPDVCAIKKDLDDLSKSCTDLASKFRQDALTDDRTSIKIQKNELDAQKWLYQQRLSLVNEIRRLRKINKYQAAKNSTNTALITKKKSDLAEQCITEAYVRRFKEELTRLGGKRIPIEIEKIKGNKGKVLHGIRLHGAKFGEPKEVLSEGEFRIVSLASFLADMLGKDGKLPFVFDDPISSLDQGYEENVAKRLAEIAQDRQVIVFTHRLSLVSLIEESADKMKTTCSVKGIFREPWGTGEPGDLLFKTTKIDSAINILRNERLPKVIKAFKCEGNTAYEPLAQGLCSDYRNLLERVIEEKLLCGVILRFRRSVQTQNKILKLANISVADCQFFDDMMTKYSCYDHSQPQEAPIEVIQPDELQSDIDALKKWNDDFKNKANQ